MVSPDKVRLLSGKGVGYCAARINGPQYALHTGWWLRHYPKRWRAAAPAVGMRASADPESANDLRRHILWAALGNAKDARHEIEKNLWASKPPVVLAATHVLGRTWTLPNRRSGQRAAVGAAAIRFSASARSFAWSTSLPTSRNRPGTGLPGMTSSTRSLDATSCALVRRKSSRNACAFDSRIGVSHVAALFY